MSTRATYKIDGHCFYIHHDGYIQGASNYFYNALVGTRRGLAESFLVENEGASFTKSHVYHDDTEFRYTVKGTDILVSQQKGQYINDKYISEWVEVYKGDLYEFVNLYAFEAITKPFKSVKLKVKLKGSTKAEVLNEVTAQRIIQEKIDLLRIWLKNGFKKSYNTDFIISEVLELSLEFDFDKSVQDDIKEIKEAIK